MKYRIRIEAIGEGAETEHEYMKELSEEGIECNGFCIIGVKDEKEHNCTFHDLTIKRLAEAMSSTSEVLQAAVMAKALNDARAIGKQFAEIKMAENFKELFARAVKSDD